MIKAIKLIDYCFKFEHASLRSSGGRGVDRLLVMGNRDALVKGRSCYRESRYRKSRVIVITFEIANSKVMFTWHFHWFLSGIKAGHWFISLYIFTDIISDYFTDAGLESCYLVNLTVRTKVFRWYRVKNILMTLSYIKKWVATTNTFSQHVNKIWSMKWGRWYYNYIYILYMIYTYIHISIYILAIHIYLINYF